MARRPKPRLWQRPKALVSAESKLVKSASRAFEILELLDDVRKPITVMELADALGYPQSSTSALLSSMVAMGYLVYEPHKRTYMTSSRVALLGSWVNEPFFEEGKVISMMKSLYARFGLTVALGMRNGHSVQYIHILQPAEGVHMPIGYSIPMAICAGGRAMMALMSSEEATRVALRHNAETTRPGTAIQVRELHEHLEQVRREGYAATYDLLFRGGAMIAACLPQIEGQRQMVLGLGGPADTVRPREPEIAQALLDGIAGKFDHSGDGTGHPDGPDAGALPGEFRALRSA